MNCPNCQTENPDYARFCWHCGNALVASARVTCPRCQMGLPAHARFCLSCGSALDGTSAADDASLKAVEPAANRETQAARERRIVTILFADVKGYTAMSERLDPEEVVEIMEGAFTALTDPIHRYEGTLVQLMGDAILAFFGAPHAHEDDPERACRAALDILAGIERYAEQLERERGIPNFTVRVGINTGLVVAGQVGVTWHTEYTVTGDPINVAARMQTTAAPGTVLITADTHKHIRHAFETQSQGLVRVKGKAEPIEVFRVVKLLEGANVPDTSADAQGAPALRGRAAELAELGAVFDNLRAGKGAPVALIGETGLGKRRLLAHARAAHAQNIAWVEAHCFSYTEGMSYWTAREILRGMLGASANDTPQDVAAALGKSIAQLQAETGDDLRASVYPYLARLLDLTLDEAHDTSLKHPGAEDLQRQLLRAFVTYVEASARRQPLALVWENLQWVDAYSLSVLESLVPLTFRVPLVLCLVFRPNEGRITDLHITLQQSLGEKYGVLELTALTAQSSALLLDDLLAAHPTAAQLPQEMRERILERAQGNPLFLAEIVRAWLDPNPVRSNQSDVPDTLQGVIMARVDRLSALERRVLQTASVIGRVFSRRVLARVMEGITEPQLTDALAELRRREFIVPGQDANAQEYSFKHNLTLDVAYNSLLIAQRKTLHRQIGEAVEAEFPERLEELAAVLAHHFEQAESHARAVYYLTRAGQRAARLYANAEAVAYYQRAIVLAAEANVPCAAQLSAQQGLGDVYNLIGAYASGVAHYEQALRCANVPQERAVLDRKLGDVYTRWGKSEQALACFEAGLHEMRDVLDAAETAHIYTGMGLVYYRRGELDAALQLGELALDLMERTGDEWGIAQACNNLGIVHGQRGDAEQAIAYHHRCLSLWEKLGDSNGIAAAHNNLGLVLQQQGDWEQAARHFETSLKRGEKVGNRHGLAFTYDNLGQVYQKLGRTPEAMECLKKAVTILFEIGESKIVPEMWQSGAW